jgi:ornithine cyclodeaminase/alanine dehydrogenase-like protein (mu-crystallin family)
MKWIASVPENIRHGLPRASGVVILNDPTTGRPYACLEASEINSVRTAVSGVLAAQLWLGDAAEASVAVVGAGRIAETVVRMLMASALRVSCLTVVDGDPVRAMRFADEFRSAFGSAVAVTGSAEEALASSTLVVFATTATVPHVSAAHPLRAGQLVLHLSLRDLQPEALRPAVNLVDDPDLACSEGTSLAVAAERFGRDTLRIRALHEFIARPAERSPVPDPAVFSPFGMGVLDVAVAEYVFRRLQDSGSLRVIPEFFSS